MKNSGTHTFYGVMFLRRFDEKNLFGLKICDG